MKIFYTKKEKGHKSDTALFVSEILKHEGMEELAYGHLDSGAPVLLQQGGGEAPVKISVSDTKHYLFACLSAQPAGLDAEECGRTLRPSAVKALHPLEKKYLQDLEPQSREWTEEFLRIWTAKESYMKFCGLGLRMGTSGFSVIDEDMRFFAYIQKPGLERARLLRPAGNGLVLALCVSETEAADGAPEPQHLPVEFPMELSSLEKAAQLLDASLLSEKKLTEKLLKKGYAADDAEQTAAELKSRGYIDDRMLAEGLARKLYQKGEGRLKIGAELAKKGIDRDTAREVMDAVFSEACVSEKERARELVLDLTQAAAEERDPRKKTGLCAQIARKLSAKGYESAVIASVLEICRE